MLNAVYRFKREGHINNDFSLEDTLVAVTHEGLKNSLKQFYVFDE